LWRTVCGKISGDVVFRWLKSYISSIFFLVSGQKAHISRPRCDSKLRVFLPLTKKNYVLPSAAKKRMSQIAVCQPRLRLRLQFACDLGHSLFLRPRIKVYCPSYKFKNYFFSIEIESWLFYLLEFFLTELFIENNGFYFIQLFYSIL